MLFLGQFFWEKLKKTIMAKRALESETKKSISANDLVLKVKDIEVNLKKDGWNFLPHKEEPRKLGDITFSDLRHSQNPEGPVYLSLTGGGRIHPRFGIGNDKSGTKTYLTVELDNEDEIKGLETLNSHFRSFLFKKEHWPKTMDPEAVPQTDREAKTMFNAFFHPPSEKKDKDKQPTGEFWPRKMKMQIPIGESGEVTNKVRVIDTEKNTVSFHSLPGLRWKALVMQLTGWYFGNGKAGISCKLKYIMVENKAPEIPSDIFDELGDPLGLDEDPLGLEALDTAPAASSIASSAHEEGTNEESKKRKKKVKVG